MLVNKSYAITVPAAGPDVGVVKITGVPGFCGHVALVKYPASNFGLMWAIVANEQANFTRTDNSGDIQDVIGNSVYQRNGQRVTFDCFHESPSDTAFKWRFKNLLPGRINIVIQGVQSSPTAPPFRKPSKKRRR